MKALITGISKTCKNCGNDFGKTKYPRGDLETTVSFNKRLFCSCSCYHAFIIGKNHPNYKNGTKSRPDGYIKDSKTDKYLHRLIMEKHIGRELTSTEIVHHKDGNNNNNDINNLEIHTNSSHRRLEIINQKRGLDGRFTT